MTRELATSERGAMSARTERRCSPKRLLLLTATALAAMGVVVGPAAADSTNAADKEQFLRVTTRGGTCENPTFTGSPTESTAVIKKNQDGRASATVTLKDAFPN